MDLDAVEGVDEGPGGGPGKGARGEVHPGGVGGGGGGHGERG